MARLQKTLLSVFFVLRFLQLAASAITGFIYCYLIWHHNNHYCVYYPSDCLPYQRRNTHIPYQYILITVAGILCFVNILATTIYFITVAQKIVYPVLVITDGIVLAIYTAGLILVFRVPGSHLWCHFFRSHDLRSNVAEKNCVIGQDGKGSLACVVGLTAFILILAILKSMRKCCCCFTRRSADSEEEGTSSLVGGPGAAGDGGGPSTGSHISVDIDVAAFMSHEQRMVIGIGDATEVAEDEKPARPIEPHPAEREVAKPVGEMEITEMTRRHGDNLI